MQLNNNYLLLLLLFVFSCKSDDKKEKNELKNANFVINDQDIKKAFDDFEPYTDTISVKQDDQKSFKVRVGDEVVFKDVSEPMNAVHEREWDFDSDSEVDDNEQIAKFKFKSPGLYEVKLIVNEKMVSKMVYVYDASTSNIASVEKIADVNGNPANNQLANVAETKQEVVVSKIKNEPPPSIKPIENKASKQLLEDAKTREVVKSAPIPTKEPTKVVEVPKPIVKPTVVTEAKKEVPKPTPIVQAEVKKETPKPNPIVNTPPPSTSTKNAEPEARLKSVEKVGASSKSKPEEDGEWVDKANISLTPMIKCKLAELFTYANNSGKVKVILRNNQNGQSVNTTGNVNKGKSQLILDDLDDITLEPGSTYSLILEPQNGIKIENAVDQKPSIRESQKLKIDYKGNVSIFDLKFRY